jgi:hypothetical protein
VTVKDYLPFLQFGCRTIDPQDPHSDQNGTYNTDFDRVLKYVGRGVFRVRKRKHPRLTTIQKHLESGGAVALAYQWWESATESNGHFCFMAGFENGMFVVANDHLAPLDNTQTMRRPTTVKSWLRHVGDDPIAWFLEKLPPDLRTP